MATRLILRGLLVIVALTLAGYLLGDLIDASWVDAHVRDHGVPGELLFLLAGWLLSGAGVSRQLIAFIGGYTFGFLSGTLLAMLASVAGCITTFYIARFLLNEFLLRHSSGRLDAVAGFIRENTFSMTVLVRLLPLGNNGVVNTAAGVSGARGIPFFLGSALGYLPQTLIFALVGSGTGVNRFSQMAVAMAMFVAATLLGARLYRNHRRDMSPGRGPDQGTGIDDSLAVR